MHGDDADADGGSARSGFPVWIVFGGPGVIDRSSWHRVSNLVPVCLIFSHRKKEFVPDWGTERSKGSYLSYHPAQRSRVWKVTQSAGINRAKYIEIY
jgi:hypothetical protein